MIKFLERHLRVCYLNQEPTVFDIERLQLERLLDSFLDFEVVKITSLESQNFLPCDLLILAALKISPARFVSWLGELGKNIKQQGAIWVPALIIADPPFDLMNRYLEEAVQMNWYFDIVSPKHTDSLPIRVANLLRIHDHLHELKRYQNSIDQLTETVTGLERAIEKLKSP